MHIYTIFATPLALLFCSYYTNEPRKIVVASSFALTFILAWQVTNGSPASPISSTCGSERAERAPIPLARFLYYDPPRRRIFTSIRHHKSSTSSGNKISNLKSLQFLFTNAWLSTLAYHAAHHSSSRPPGNLNLHRPWVAHEAPHRARTHR
jgi:hypothetical protein